MKIIYLCIGFVVFWAGTGSITFYLGLLGFVRARDWLRRTYNGHGWIGWRFNRKLKSDVAKRAARSAGALPTLMFLRIMEANVGKQLRGYSLRSRRRWSWLIHDTWVRTMAGKHGDWRSVDQALAQAEQGLTVGGGRRCRACQRRAR